MKKLHLTLKKKWFDMILSGEKKEEYREIKPYWSRRLLSCSSINRRYCENCKMLDCENEVAKIPKKFTSIVFKNGYSKNCRQFEIELNSISINVGKIKLGAPKLEMVFILELGGILSSNCG